jgi:hypothetical protein
MGVPKVGIQNSLMVYNGKSDLKMDDLGVRPFGNLHMMLFINILYDHPMNCLVNRISPVAHGIPTFFT